MENITGIKNTVVVNDLFKRANDIFNSTKEGIYNVIIDIIRHPEKFYPIAEIPREDLYWFLSVVTSYEKLRGRETSYSGRAFLYVTLRGMYKDFKEVPVSKAIKEIGPVGFDYLFFNS